MRPKGTVADCTGTPRECSRGDIARVRRSGQPAFVTPSGDGLHDEPLNSTLTDGDLPPPAQWPDDGPRLVGRYMLLEPLGSGGMGTVYTAYDPELDRRVALKLLHPGRDDDSAESKGRMRMLREAQAIAKVTHPNVVVVHDAGVVEVDGESKVFLTMELVAGQTLRRFMGSLHGSPAWRRGQRAAELVDVLLHAARGLAAAHDAGIMHRDFKPENVLIGRDGVARVVDFGLARRVDTADVVDPSSGARAMPAALTTVTETGALLGTPAYMSPEQFLGHGLDARTDQFSFCATFYEALLGVRPFEGTTTPEVTLAVMGGKLRDTPKVPPVSPTLVAALHRGLATEPDDRFVSMHELVAAIEAATARRPLRRWATGGAMMLAAGAAIAAFPATPADDDPCDAGIARSAEVWNDSTRNEVATALVLADSTFADRARDSTLRTLDEYAEAWQQGHRDACEATHVRFEQTGELLDRRMACLDQRLAAMKATAHELTQTDVDASERAITAVEALPPLAPCSNVTVLTAAVAPPADAATRAKVGELRAMLAASVAKRTLHRFSAALELVEETAADAAGVDYAPLHVEIEYARAQSLLTLGKDEEAVEGLTAAIWAAQEAGMDALIVDAATTLGKAVGTKINDAEQGLIWLRLAEATARRIGITPDDEARLAGARALVLVEWHHNDEAVEAAEQAVAAAEAAYGANSSQRIGNLQNMGAVYGRLARFTDAERVFGEALSLARTSVGPGHPTLMRLHLNLGNSLAPQGKVVEAREHLEAAVAIGESLASLPPAEAARNNNSLGNLLLGEKNFAAARERLQVALELRKIAHGPRHPQVARTLNSLGQAQQGLGLHVEAIATYRESVQIREEAFGGSHAELALPLENMGVAMMRAEQVTDAAGVLLRADEIINANPKAYRPFRHADHRYWLGRALYESGEDPARGHALVVESVDALRESGPGRAPEKATRWLAEHPAPSQ